MRYLSAVKSVCFPVRVEFCLGAAASSMDATQVCDVAVIGAGVTGLAAAVALHHVRPDLTIKVYEQRPRPPYAGDDAGSSSDLATSSKAGGGVRLEANGLKAATAISRRLARGIMAEGLFSQRVLLHDIEGGPVVTRMQKVPQLSAPTTKQAALVIGWAELEQLLLRHLPPNTMEWGCVATSYQDHPAAGGATLQVLATQPPSAPACGNSSAGGPDQQEQRAAGAGRHGPAAAAAKPGVSPFELAADSAAPASTGSSASSGHSPQAAEDAAPAANGTDATPAAAASSGRDQLQSAGSADTGAGGCQRVVVRARLLLAADGARSLLRQQCVGDGWPQFDGTIRWVGRMPGDLLSTIPVSCEAWWLSPGTTFNSHPLSCGDVAWEAQVDSSQLTAAGCRWVADQQSAVSVGASRDREQPHAPAPAGAVEESDELSAGGPQAAQATQAARMPPHDLLQLVFASFPTAVRSMIAATPPAALLEAAVHTRSVRQLPPCLGSGSLAILGLAAHPIRPTGQDVSQAFEDAAVLGAAVMQFGCRREALRQFEITRRNRWKHVMQVSQALGSCSNLGGVSLHQGLLDSTSELYRMTFVPLRSVVPSSKRPLLRRRLLQLAGAALLASSAATGLGLVAGVLARGRGKGGASAAAGPLGRVIAGVENTGQAVGKAVSGVAAAAAAQLPADGVGGALGEQLRQAAHMGAKAEHGVGWGLSKAAHTVAEVAEETAGTAGGSNGGGAVVHGAVAGSGDKVRGPAGRLRDALLGRTLAAGSLLSRPFTRLIKHRMVTEVASHLGAF